MTGSPVKKVMGMKFDHDKPRMGLLPPKALVSVADVLTAGAKKYLPNNWKYVDNANERYLDAALRHIFAYTRGETTDGETGLPHLSHALCCLMFIVDRDLTPEGYGEPPDAPKFMKIDPNTIASAKDYKTDVMDDIIKDMLREARIERTSTRDNYTLPEIMQFWKTKG